MGLIIKGSTIPRVLAPFSRNEGLDIGFHRLKWLGCLFFWGGKRGPSLFSLCRKVFFPNNDAFPSWGSLVLQMVEILLDVSSNKNCSDFFQWDNWHASFCREATDDEPPWSYHPVQFPTPNWSWNAPWKRGQFHLWERNQRSREWKGGTVPRSWQFWYHFVWFCIGPRPWG